MAINDEIAAGGRPVQFENPLNNMVKFANIQNDMANLQLHKQKAEADAAGMARKNELYNYLGSGGRDPNRIFQLGGHEELNQIRQGDTAEKLGKKTTAETDKIHDDTAAQALRNISQNPSDEVIRAHNLVYQLNPNNSPERKAKSQQTTDMLLAMPLGQRPAWLGSQNASAADLKPSQHMIAAGDKTVILSTPAFGGPSTEVGSVPMGATMKEKFDFGPKYLAEVAARDKTADDIKKTTALYDSSSGTPMREVYSSQLKDFYTRQAEQDKRIAGMKEEEAALKQNPDAKLAVINAVAKLRRENVPETDPQLKDLVLQMEYNRTHPAPAPYMVLDKNGNLTAVDKRTILPVGRLEGVGKPQQDVVQKDLTGKVVQDKRMTPAMSLIVSNQTASMANLQNAIKQVELHPGAFGAQNYLLPDAVIQRTDPGGVPARAGVANLASMKIHDRSGAAVTVGEIPRLRPFIPNVGDEPSVVVSKMRDLFREMKVENDAYLKTISGQGYFTGEPAAPPAEPTLYKHPKTKGGDTANPLITPR
jgi:hypothetical protein